MRAEHERVLAERNRLELKGAGQALRRQSEDRRQVEGAQVRSRSVTPIGGGRGSGGLSRSASAVVLGKVIYRKNTPSVADG
jgi:hypothetical protein